MVVVGLPRGGVPVAAEVARALDAPLDVIVVRKLGVPFQPELGMGALGEDGVEVLNRNVIAMAGVTDREFAAVEARESAELRRRAERFRVGRERVPLTGRIVVVVDDGVATGSTARAACEVVRAHGAARVVLAVPVAPADWTRRLADAADELVCVTTPTPFFGIGQFYDDFSQTTDDEVIRHLRAAAATATPTSPAPGRPVAGDDPPIRYEEIEVEAGPLHLGGHLAVPETAQAVVVFAHGSGSSFAVVSRGGRPDLAGRLLGSVRAPTLLIVGGRDDVVLGLNREAQARLRCPSKLTVIPGATHLFGEPGALQAAAAAARDWFLEHAPRAQTVAS